MREEETRGMNHGFKRLRVRTGRERGVTGCGGCGRELMLAPDKRITRALREAGRSGRESGVEEWRSKGETWIQERGGLKSKTYVSFETFPKRHMTLSAR